MHTELIELMGGSPGTRHTLQILRFGTSGAQPKIYIQGALHADEVPAILVAHQLAKSFAELESAGHITGEIVLVPFANPVGMGQQVMGQHHGRFDLRDGSNFNRGYAELSTAVLPTLQDALSSDKAENTRLIKRALAAAANELQPTHAVQDLKKQLLRLAIDADVVLDLHCDSDAVMHVYGLTPQAAMVESLGAALGAQAVLLATESGDSPFDEACTRPWLELQKKLPDLPIELGCFGATIELRGETDTTHAMAQQDAEGICNFLAHWKFVQGAANPVPAALCAATPLSGSEPITAPCSGVVVFHCKPGDTVAGGDVICDMVDAATGAVTPVRCKSGGVLYARASTRWASPGKRLAKIAGTSLARTGKLLSP